MSHCHQAGGKISCFASVSRLKAARQVAIKPVLSLRAVVPCVMILSAHCYSGDSWQAKGKSRSKGGTDQRKEA